MDWNKHATVAKQKAEKPKRMAITVTPQLEQAIAAFKQRHPNVTKDTAVIMTMIEAGFSQWAAEVRREQQEALDAKSANDA